MSKLAEWVLVQLRPRDGWVPFLLAVVAMFCVPLILLQQSDVLDSTVLLLTLLALASGLRLARSRLSGGTATGIAVIVGLVSTAILIAELVPPISLLLREAGYAFQWMGRALAGEATRPLPFALALRYSGGQLGDLVSRIWTWSQALSNEGLAQESIALEIVAGLLTWTLTFFATWRIFRRQDVLVGLLPGGAVIATAAFFAGGMSYFYLVVYLLCALSLHGASRLLQKREGWDEAGIDYHGELGTDLALALAASLTVIMTLAVLLPVVHPQQIRDAFWRVMDGPWSTVERTAERLFGPMERGGSPLAGAGGSLPQGHLLGGAIELAETVAFYVRTDDPAPPLRVPEQSQDPQGYDPRRYWRQLTYDTYTGLGWANGPLEELQLAADELLPPAPSGETSLYQEFELQSAQGPVLYAANAPERVSHAVLALRRAPGDLVQISGPHRFYSVLSRPPEPDTRDLELASAALPDYIERRYLALPDSVPGRVLDLAAEVAGQADTRFEKAVAIEAFLRKYPYSLDLPVPPGDRDLVDYFLFEQQKGYCDYYASAMVVMARAVGVPARFATGYAQGTFDHHSGRWVVVEKDGHSWVEIYFDELGWVEFEPTAGQPALVRAGNYPVGSTVPSIPTRAPDRIRVWGLLILAGILSVVAIAGIRIWGHNRGSKTPASTLIQDRQARLLQWGARIGRPFQDGQTPYEYGDVLADTVRRRGQSARWEPVRSAGAEAPNEIGELARAFVQTQYSSEPTTDRDSWRVRDLWVRLRRRLWWLWLGGDPDGS